MKASTWLTVRVENGVVMISSSTSIPFTFLGATCPTIIQPSNGKLTSLQARLLPGSAPSLLAIMVNTSGHGFATDHGFIIPIMWSDGGDKVIVDLDKTYISPVSRMGQVLSIMRPQMYTEFPILQVEASGQSFVSGLISLDDKDKELLVTQDSKRRFVSNGTMLLEYLQGTVTEADLEKFASEDKRTQTERELDLLRREHSSLHAQLEQARQAGLNHACQIGGLQADVETEKQRANQLSESVNLLQSHAEKMSRFDELLKLILSNRGVQHTLFGRFSRSKINKVKRLLKSFDL